MSLVYHGTRRIHGLLKSRLLQMIIHPFILIIVLSICCLVLYKLICIGVIDFFNSYDSSSDGINGLTLDLNIVQNDFQPMDVLNSKFQQYIESIPSLYQSNQDEMIQYIQYVQNSTIDDITNQLDSINAQNSKISTVSNKFLESIKGLNSTVVDDLAQQQTVISNYRDKLLNGLYVGDTIDLSGLSLNLTDVQNDFNSILDDNNDTNDTITIDLDLIIKDIETTFNSTIDQIKDDSVDFKWNSTSIHFNDLFNPVYSSMNVKNSSNGSVNSTGDTYLTEKRHRFIVQMDQVLIILGIFCGLVYLLLLTYQYYRFKLETNLRLQLFVELENREKDRDVDYVEILRRYDDVSTTLLTDIELKVIGSDDQKNRLFWVNDYFIGFSSRISTLLVLLVVVLILMLGVSKMNWDGYDYDTTVTTGTSLYELNKYYNLPTLNESYFDTIDEINDEIDELFQQQYEFHQDSTKDLMDELAEIYDEYNLTVNQPNVSLAYTPHQVVNDTSLIDLMTFYKSLSNIEIKMTAKVETNSTVNISSKITGIMKLNHIIQTLIKATLKWLAISLGSVLTILVLFGVGYCFWL